MLSESQAWEKIARAFYKPPSKRSQSERWMTNDGICYAVSELFDLISDEIYDIMKTKLWTDVELYAKGNKFCRDEEYFCELETSNDPLRADFCQLQSYMTETGD